MGMVKPKVTCEISGACLGYIHSKRLVYVAPEKTSNTLTVGGGGFEDSRSLSNGCFRKSFQRECTCKGPGPQNSLRHSDIGNGSGCGPRAVSGRGGR